MYVEVHSLKKCLKGPSPNNDEERNLLNLPLYLKPQTFCWPLLAKEPSSHQLPGKSMQYFYVILLMNQ